MKRVGFIGVGIMGSSMVRNLMKDGHEVHIYARNKEKVEQVIADGAVFHDTNCRVCERQRCSNHDSGVSSGCGGRVSWRRQGSWKVQIRERILST